MTAVFKREFKAYFYSPLGYVFIAAFFLLSGYFFFNYNLYGNTTDMRNLFGTLFTVALFFIPILTMRLMSEDRKLKTDQILLMAPIGTADIVIGKLLAAILVFMLAISDTLIIAVVISTFATPEWPVIIGHLTGLLLLGIALISIGMFVSSMTENQIIAAIGGFCVSLFLMLIETLAPIIGNGFLRAIVTNMSFRMRYTPFTLGILDFSNCIFFLSVAGMFTFFTMCAFEKRRWS